MTQKSCAVGMRNAKLGNHLKRVFLLPVDLDNKIWVNFVAGNLSFTEFAQVLCWRQFSVSNMKFSKCTKTQSYGLLFGRTQRT